MVTTETVHIETGFRTFHAKVETFESVRMEYAHLVIRSISGEHFRIPYYGITKMLDRFGKWSQAYKRHYRLKAALQGVVGFANHDGVPGNFNSIWSVVWLHPPRMLVLSSLIAATAIEALALWR